MKILITARYISGSSKEGGSSKFYNCLINEFTRLGHDVTATKQPEKYSTQKFDVIISSHPERLRVTRNMDGYKIHISQGIVKDEQPIPGADLYLGISEEVITYNNALGYETILLRQPIELTRFFPENVPSEIKNILIIRRYRMKNDPFACLSKHYNVNISNPNIPIETQIKENDMCITLGRGALESISIGKPVIIGDNRGYIGAVGDGYLNPRNIRDIAANNYSGRATKQPITEQWLLQEIKKYNPNDMIELYQMIDQMHGVQHTCKHLIKFTEYKKISTTKHEYIKSSVDIKHPKPQRKLLMV